MAFNSSKLPPWLSCRVPRSVVAAVIIGALTPVIVLAVDLFLDVPPSHVFYNDINAIALAGITSGCGGGNYCPDAPVTRAQMAAFMHRGLSRVTRVTLAGNTVTETSDNQAATVGSGDLVVGLPAGALAGAAGFIEGHASLILLAPATGCPCEYWAGLRDATEGFYLMNWYTRQTVSNSEIVTTSITGARKIQSTGTHTIELRVFRTAGTGTGAVARGDFTVSYHPFGGTGTNTLGPEVSATGSSEIGRTPQ
jgi:S-layer family protein